MSVTYNAKGTSVPYFTIGKRGVTIYQGLNDPTGNYAVSESDVWIDTTTKSLRFYSNSVWSPPKFVNSRQPTRYFRCQ